MNIALERCTEIVDGGVARNWGDAFVRGNNGIYSPPYPPPPLPLIGSTVTYICADTT